MQHGHAAPAAAAPHLQRAAPLAAAVLALQLPSRLERVPDGTLSTGMEAILAALAVATDEYEDILTANAGPVLGGPVVAAAVAVAWTTTKRAEGCEQAHAQPGGCGQPRQGFSATDPSFAWRHVDPSHAALNRCPMTTPTHGPRAHAGAACLACSHSQLGGCRRSAATWGCPTVSAWQTRRRPERAAGRSGSCGWLVPLWCEAWLPGREPAPCEAARRPPPFQGARSLYIMKGGSTPWKLGRIFPGQTIAQTIA
jgi:hypothetical protein